MNRLGILILSMSICCVLAAHAVADIVETTTGTVYQGTIIKLDEKEVVIKTSSGVARVPRQQIKSFQSEPVPGKPTVQKKAASTLGESGKEAVRGLKKLQARCKAGISYKDYGVALGEAKFEVNLFLESQDAKKRGKLAESIDKIMEHYEFAGTVWRHKFSGGRGVTETISLKSDFGQSILKFYPNANKDFKEGGALATFEGYSSSSLQIPERTDIFIDALLPVIWKEASDELKRATSLLSE